MHPRLRASLSALKCATAPLVLSDTEYRQLGGQNQSRQEILVKSPGFKVKAPIGGIKVKALQHPSIPAQSPAPSPSPPASCRHPRPLIGVIINPPPPSNILGATRPPAHELQPPLLSLFSSFFSLFHSPFTLLPHVPLLLPSGRSTMVHTF